MTCDVCQTEDCDSTDAEACLGRVVAARDRAQSRLDKLSARFSDHAADAGVPVEVVADAAAHTFDMLDVEQQVELIEDAVKRWGAHRKIVNKTGIVIAEGAGEMRSDLVYRLQHEHFDLIYAVAIRRDDAPGGDEHAAWVITPPRRGEDDTPTHRVIKMLDALVRALRLSRQKFEDVLRMTKTKYAAQQKQKKDQN